MDARLETREGLSASLQPSVRKAKFREGEAPAEPGSIVSRRPPEAPKQAISGRRAKARLRLGRSLALPSQTPSEVDNSRGAMTCSGELARLSHHRIAHS